MDPEKSFQPPLLESIAAIKATPKCHILKHLQMIIKANWALKI